MVKVDDKWKGDYGNSVATRMSNQMLRLRARKLEQ